MQTPVSVSVVILNYNGAKWIRKCIQSVLEQTIIDRMEIIVADNQSTDGSMEIAAEVLGAFPRGSQLRHATNLGFCEGNNRAADCAHGDYLFFLNNDAWLEPDCMERLLDGLGMAGASAATPYVMNWADNSYQWVYVSGYDIFGLPSFKIPPEQVEPLFMPPGCSYLIKRELFNRIGRFDPQYFMYADEYDLSWRVWISGHSAVVVPAARLHHRGAAEVNPAGGERIVEFRTSVSKRYYTNRNCLITLLKNSRHLLLLLVPLQILLLLAESLATFLLCRQWPVVKRAYFAAIADTYKLLPEIMKARRLAKTFRRRGDLWMLRFFRCRLNRWDELRNVFRMGPPKIAIK